MAILNDNLSDFSVTVKQVCAVLVEETSKTSRSPGLLRTLRKRPMEVGI